LRKKILIYIIVSIALFSCKTTEMSIEEKKWYLTEIEGDSEIILVNDKIPYIEFDLESEKLGGNASCNNFFTNYKIEDNHIEFGQIATTMMACPDNTNQEYRFLQAMSRIDTFKIENGLLYFFEGEEAILIFSSKK